MDLFSYLASEIACRGAGAPDAQPAGVADSASVETPAGTLASPCPPEQETQPAGGLSLSHPPAGVCPQCDAAHDKSGTFCSVACSNRSRLATRVYESAPCQRPGCTNMVRRPDRNSYCSKQCLFLVQVPAAEQRVRDKIAQLWNEGLPTSEIGRRLGITKNAVIGRARRMHLPSRPSPVRPKSSLDIEKITKLRELGMSYARVARKFQVTEGAIYYAVNGSLSGPRTEEPAPIERKVTLAPLASLQAANINTEPMPIGHSRACQWPMWGAIEANGRPIISRTKNDPRPGSSPQFCCAKTIFGSSYCPMHFRMGSRAA